MGHNVSVALCTCNGEKYIKEQIISILSQTLLPTEIVISDDASTDRTIEIISSMIFTSKCRLKIIKNQERVGVKKNFEKAIKACGGEYIALCDQDDVWLPNKLELCMKKMIALENENDASCPILVHSDLKIVDQELNVIADSMMEYEEINNEKNMEDAIAVLAVQNYVTGCSIFMNRTLANISCPIPNNVIMHDWWIALLAASLGRIGYVDEALILYRQHLQNTIGARKMYSMSTMIRLLNMEMLRKSVKSVIVQAYKAYYATQNEKLKEWLSSIRKGDFFRIIKCGMHKQTLIKNIAFYILLLYDRKEIIKLFPKI